MRRFLCGMTAALVLLTGVCAAEDARVDMVRLHVVAEDDTPEAQWLKLKVRDAILDKAREVLAECADAREAYDTLTDRLSELEDAAEARARREGYAGEILAETGVFPFPDRSYGGVTVPAGDYPALRVVIGAGEGRNWWCVLYPSLCLSSEEGYDSVFGNWLRRWFGGEEACEE